jgi:hypothetical protein
MTSDLLLSMMVVKIEDMVVQYRLHVVCMIVTHEHLTGTRKPQVQYIVML